MADLHNLVASFAASHGLSDEWHLQKIIFLLGCNKSYVKCSSAYKETMWQKKADARFLFVLARVPFLLLCHEVFSMTRMRRHVKALIEMATLQSACTVLGK